MWEAYTDLLISFEGLLKESQTEIYWLCLPSTWLPSEKIDFSRASEGLICIFFKSGELSPSSQMETHVKILWKLSSFI